MTHDKIAYANKGRQTAPAVIVSGVLFSRLSRPPLSRCYTFALLRKKEKKNKRTPGRRLPQDGMLVHRRLPTSISSGYPDNFPIPIHFPGWREALFFLKNTTTMTLSRAQTYGPLILETSALIIDM